MLSVVFKIACQEVPIVDRLGRGSGGASERGGHGAASTQSFAAGTQPFTPADSLANPDALTAAESYAGTDSSFADSVAGSDLACPGQVARAEPLEPETSTGAPDWWGRAIRWPGARGRASRWPGAWGRTARWFAVPAAAGRRPRRPARTGGWERGPDAPATWPDTPDREGALGGAPDEIALWPGAWDRAGRWLGKALIAAVKAGRKGYQLVVARAAGRGVAANSVTGFSLLFGLCAAAWLSGGTTGDTRLGMIAAAAWLITRLCAARLAAFPEGAGAAGAGMAGAGMAGAGIAGAGIAGAGMAGAAGSDWLVLPGYNWDATASPARDDPVSHAERRQRQPERAPAVGWQVGNRSFTWLAAICGTGAECAIYGGIAAGAEAAGWKGTWPLAIATVIGVSVADVAATCARVRKGEPAAEAGPAEAGPAEAGARERALWGWVTAMASPPVSARVLLAVIALAAYGPRVALLAVFTLAALSLGWNFARIGGRPATSQDAILACRDDGLLASFAGRLVRGNLMPLPAVLAGLAAIAVLTLIGISTLPGILAVTPVVVLLLAAPGASHPHDGRFDWLVPVLLCLGQYGYLAAFGLARDVAGPVIFAACAISAVWYAGLAAGPPGMADNLGWDGRICLVALAGMLGITAFGYLGLSVCTGILIARRVVIGYLIPAVPQTAGPLTAGPQTAGERP